MQTKQVIYRNICIYTITITINVCIQLMYVYTQEQLMKKGHESEGEWVEAYGRVWRLCLFIGKLSPFIFILRDINDQ